jgi:hypothetical protein
MDGRELHEALRDQMSNLCSVFALSMMLFDRVDEEEILKLVTSSVPALGPWLILLPVPARSTNLPERHRMGDGGSHGQRRRDSTRCMTEP